MMGGLSIWHWAIVAVVVALLFGGKGKLSSIMGDAAKGIKAFRDGLKHEDHAETPPPPPGALPNESTLERQAADKTPR